jgi:hypothetical protein
MTISHKKKVFHKTPIIITTPPPTPGFSSIQPPFILENNRPRHLQQQKDPNYVDIVYNDPSTGSSSTESSASSITTLRHVDSFSSDPVVIPPKFFYRRR